jgi:adenylyltransferase/sulfurtransferase
MAEILARAGVGTLRVADRDYLEVHNLQRQSLYTEEDVESGLPKAAAAARHLQAMNSEITVEAHTVDVTPENVLELLEGATVVLDGTDNLQTRYLLNDACVKLGLPWVYGGVVGVSGVTMGIVPGETACLRCLFPSAPPPGEAETCDVAGVLGPAAYVTASIAAAEAIKRIVGQGFTPGLLAADLWRGTWDRIEVERDPDCPACARGELEYLEGEEWGRESARLCGRDAVQVRLPGRTPDFEALATRWRSSGLGEVLANPYVVRLRTDKHELTLFPDSRVIVKGTDDAGVARGLVAKYIGM